MKEIHLIKTDAGYFIPAYNSDKELSDQIKTGEVIKVKYSKPRNYKFHKKYFDLLNLAYGQLCIFFLNFLVPLPFLNRFLIPLRVPIEM